MIRAICESGCEARVTYKTGRHRTLDLERGWSASPDQRNPTGHDNQGLTAGQVLVSWEPSRVALKHVGHPLDNQLATSRERRSRLTRQTQGANMGTKLYRPWIKGEEPDSSECAEHVVRATAQSTAVKRGPII